MNKTIALLILGLILVIVGSVIIINEQSNSSTVPDSEENTIDNNNDKVLYFYKNTYVGYLSDGLWHMPSDVTLNNILNNSQYTVYTKKLKKNTAKKLEINLLDEVDGLKISDENGNTITNSDLTTLFHKYTDKKHSGLSAFSLPVTLPKEYANYKTINLKDTQKYSVVAISNKSSYEKSVEENLISFNKDYELDFAKESEIDFIPEDVKSMMIDSFSEYNVEQDLPHSPQKYYNFDLNKDDTKDEIYYFTFNSNSSETSTNTQFSVIITRVNNNLEVLYKNTNSSTNTEEIDLEVVDLNQDNYYEILYSTKNIESSWNYLAVLRGNGFINLFSKNFDYSKDFTVDFFKYQAENIATFNDVKYKNLISNMNDYIESANALAQKDKDKNVYVYTSLSKLYGDNSSYFYYGYFESDMPLSELKSKVDSFMRSEYAHDPMNEKSPFHSEMRQYNLKLSEEDSDCIVNGMGELWNIIVLEDGTIKQQERLFPGET